MFKGHSVFDPSDRTELTDGTERGSAPQQPNDATTHLSHSNLTVVFDLTLGAWYGHSRVLILYEGPFPLT
jgi:hypothetical protein